MNKIDCIISLGEECTIAYYLKSRNYRKFSLPFDYITSDLDIIIDLMDNNFKDFFNVTKHNIHNDNFNADGTNTIFINNVYENLTFPHHNLNSKKIVESFQRRITRFKNLISSDCNIIFIHLHFKKQINIDKFISSINRFNPKCKFKLITLHVIQHNTKNIKKLNTDDEKISSYEIHYCEFKIYEIFSYVDELLKDYNIDTLSINDIK